MGGRMFDNLPVPVSAGIRMHNMTYLALASSHYVNGVAKKHSEISQHMFADYTVDAITNGLTHQVLEFTRRYAVTL